MFPKSRGSVGAGQSEVGATFAWGGCGAPPTNSQIPHHFAGDRPRRTHPRLELYGVRIRGLRRDPGSVPPTTADRATSTGTPCTARRQPSPGLGSRGCNHRGMAAVFVISSTRSAVRPGCSSTRLRIVRTACVSARSNAPPAGGASGSGVGRASERNSGPWSVPQAAHRAASRSAGNGSLPPWRKHSPLRRRGWYGWRAGGSPVV
jgi:hypothetical protein